MISPLAPAGSDREASGSPIPFRAVAGWVVYDLANTIFSMGVISLYLPLWVHDTVGGERADAVFGTIMAISMALIFVVSPLLGSMTDRASRRMPFLAVSTVVCVVCTALLARAGFAITAVSFVIANIGFQAALQFYDSLLPSVSTEENRGRVGGIGVGIGYLGSYLAVGIGFLLPEAPKSTLFLVIAVSFQLLALPCILFVKEKRNPTPRPINLRMAVESTRETIRTLRSTQQFPGLLRFLIGRVFYTDSINTVIGFMALFTVNIALFNDPDLGREAAEKQARIIFMSAITFAVIGGFVWGWLVDRLGPKRTLNLVLGSWVAIFAFAGMVGIVGLPLWSMYVVAATAGFALGGVQASDRPYMLRLAPPWRLGEFYGLYGMVGRFSAITGPVIWAAVTHFTVARLGLEARVGQGVSILVLMAFVLISLRILQPVSDTKREWRRNGSSAAGAMGDPPP